MKTLYDDIRDHRVFEDRGSWRTLLPPAICAACAGLFLLAFQFAKEKKALMNWMIRHITTPYKTAVSKFCDLFPFAVSEVIWVVAILAALVFLVRTIYLLIRYRGRILRLGRRLLALLSAVLIVYCGYTVLWGMNYYGDDFSDLSGIATRGATTQELATLCASFAQALNNSSDQVERDENGVFTTDLDALFSSTGGLYDGIEAEFPFLAGAEHTPKRMVSSPIMSRLNFTGFLFPFTGETLINDVSPQCLIPSTILHEMAHQRNIAGEDEANFVAILAGLRSGNMVYYYSSALLGYIHLCNALYSADASAYQQISSTLNQQVRADLSANNAYWNSFDSTLEKAAESVSSTVYEGFLQSYGQTDGMKTYGKCVDLLVAYYFDYLGRTTDAT